MGKKSTSRFNWFASVLILALILSGCGGNSPDPTVVPSAVPTDIPPTEAAVAATPEAVQPTAADENTLYHDDFTNPSTGWPDDKFDNFFIGYHEPEFYHVEVDSPNYKTTVFEPGKDTFGDASIIAKAFTASAKTAETGDFIFGPAFRRSGDQYYAFTISQRTKKWYLLKSTPNALVVLAEGTDDSIHAPDEEDVIQVDAAGANFSLYINNHAVGQFMDADYASGEVGFFVQTFDADHAHVHFDELTVTKLTQSQGEVAVGYHDDFTNPSSGWPADSKFDNFFIGYHEPEFYHVEVDSPNYKTTVFEPGKDTFGDASIVVKAFTASAKTAETGDFTFGPAFRRSGDQYYAFTISQRTKKWYLLKSTPNALVVLAEGTDDSIHAPDEEDVIQVDAAGANFSLYINGHAVGQVTDADYASGEVGFFVQTFDADHAHVHFDELTVTPLEFLLTCIVKARAMYVRSGPGTGYESSTFLTTDDIIEPIGRTDNGDWLLISQNDSDGQRWVFYSSGLLSCNDAIDILPVISP